MGKEIYVCIADTETIDSQRYADLCGYGCCWDYQWEKEGTPDELIEEMWVRVLDEKDIDNHLNQPILKDVIYVQEYYSSCQHKISKELFIKNFKLIDN